MATQFFMPVQNIIGAGALAQAMDAIAALGLKKALIVTDGGLSKMGVADQIGGLLKEKGIDYAVFDQVQPNPTVSNVNVGLAKLKESSADCVISLGGGSSHDAAKAIAIVAANGGKIEDYEGLDKSKKPQIPLVAINTTAG
ncbi:iron-containing alcohol dehydrogenase, partial [Neisseria dentiae]